MFSVIKAFFTKKDTGRLQNLHLSDVSSTCYDDSGVQVKEKKSFLGFAKNIFSNVVIRKSSETRETRGSRSGPHRKEGITISETKDKSSKEPTKNNNLSIGLWVQKAKKFNPQIKNKLSKIKYIRIKQNKNGMVSKGGKGCLKKKFTSFQDNESKEGSICNVKKEIPRMCIYDIWEMIECPDSMREQLRAERIRKGCANRG
ncbi:hypothetical protein BB560_004593 [Smittium megazygosporum]|uniref:Uncharacterized protein n=1 Tax=Smittium megazygosporum TaxID=133381 RepID=A0A2T9Z8S8_9FUNG|nr:hypothetical protein BB560_004593 [Smittium megazygosporum]